MSKEALVFQKQLVAERLSLILMEPILRCATDRALIRSFSFAGMTTDFTDLEKCLIRIVMSLSEHSERFTEQVTMILLSSKGVVDRA